MQMKYIDNYIITSSKLTEDELDNMLKSLGKTANYINTDKDLILLKCMELRKKWIYYINTTAVPIVFNEKTSKMNTKIVGNFYIDKDESKFTIFDTINMTISTFECDQIINFLYYGVPIVDIFGKSEFIKFTKALCLIFKSKKIYNILCNLSNFVYVTILDWDTDFSNTWYCIYKKELSEYIYVIEDISEYIRSKEKINFNFGQDDILYLKKFKNYTPCKSRKTEDIIEHIKNYMNDYIYILEYNTTGQ